MAKNSVEKKIKEVLHERTMAPTENAWSKIEEQLGSASEANKKGYWAYGIAAGFIGILFVSVFYLSQPGAEVIPSQEVVKSTDNNSDLPNTLEIKESLKEDFENNSDFVKKDPLQENRQLPNEVLVQSVVQPKLFRPEDGGGLCCLREGRYQNC